MLTPNQGVRQHRQVHAAGAKVRPLTIRLLGGFHVLSGNEPVPDRAWRLRKAQVLVQLLALAPRHRLHREQVMDLFWPHLTLEAAAQNFHQIVHVARRALSSSTSKRRSSKARTGFLVVRRQVVSLHTESPPWIDVVAFEQAAARARRTRCLSDYAKALALYEGDLLPESPYEEVFAEHRRRLRELQLGLRIEKAALHEEAGHWSEAADTYRGILADDATVEAAVAGMLRTCTALNARDEAARYFQTYVRQIRDELGLEPDPELQRLFVDMVRPRRTTRPSNLSANRDIPLVISGLAARRQLQNVTEETSFDQRAFIVNALPLVGREREQNIVKIALQQSDRGSVFLVAGEPGIGKSRFVRESCLLASTANFPVAVGIGIGEGETPPFGPWKQVLHEFSARTGRSYADLPAPLGERQSPVPVEDLALSMADFLTAGPQAVIVLEDLQWFDSASLYALQQALPRFVQSKLHLFITCRTQNLKSEPLSSVVRSLLRSGAEWLELQRLDQDEIAALAQAAGKPERARLVYERSGGNPFFACHLLATTGEALPWTIQQAIAERLEALRPRNVEVLKVAALLGKTIALPVLQATTQLPDIELDAAIDEACTHGLILRSGSGYAFAHDLIRQELIDSLSQDERVRIHRRAATAVTDPDAAAYHLGAAGDPAAVPLLFEAGQRAMLWGAVEQAHHFFERALELASVDDPLRCQILLLLAVRTDSKHLVHRQQYLESAADEADRIGDTLVAGLARRLLAEILFTQNDDRTFDLFEQALLQLDQACDDPRLEQLEALTDRRILLYPGMSTLMYALHRHSRGGDPVAAVHAAIARKAPRPRSHEDYFASAFAHLIRGDVRGTVRQMTAGGERAIVSRSYVTATWCFAVAMNVLLWQSGTNRDSIEAIMERMCEAAELARDRLGRDPFPDSPFMMPYWYWYGQWDLVSKVFEEFLCSGATINGSVSTFAYAYGADVMRERGHIRPALSTYAAMLPSSGPHSKPGVLHYIPQMSYITLAIRTMIAAGEHTMAHAWLETVDEWHRGPRPNPINYSWTLIEWAEWHRAHGDIEAMCRVAEKALHLSHEIEATYVQYNALRLLGIAGGSKAADHLTRALDLAERCGFPFDIARARLERGRPDDLKIAREIFADLGATPYLHRLDRLTGSDV